MGTSETYKGFPWRPGMLTTDGERIVRVDDGMVTGSCDMDMVSWHVTSLVGQVVVPDLTDPATVGALAGVVREMYSEWFAVCCLYRGSCEAWNVVGRRQAHRDRHEHAVLGEGETEALAWLAAYHAHPSVASSASPPGRGDATDLGVGRG